MDYEPIIGLEVHVQLLTRSKMFCSCRADYQTAQPNSRVCPVCMGMPGVLPVINRRAVEYTAMTGLALNCSIASSTKFDRKNYPYPDLMKGYQISQYDTPIAYGGYLDIEEDGSTKRVGITRVHLEEDVAKLQHITDPGAESYSLVDVNRSGVPLMEVVSEPDMRSPEEARHYLTTLHTILQYVGVSTANLQDGSFRCDANISIRPRGSAELMSRVEVKNMNSFRAVYNALQYEVDRQVRLVGDGGKVAQETRGWSEERNATVPQRSKEYAHDYRYFPEPDLPPLVLDPGWVEGLRARLPELPSQRRARIMEQYGLSFYDADRLTSSRAIADFFEASMDLSRLEPQATAGRAKAVSNWVLGELGRLLNENGGDIGDSTVTPACIVELIDLVEAGTVSLSLAKTVLEEVFASGEAPGKIVRERGYIQISDSSVLGSAVEEAIDANPQAVADYVKGKETAAKFLVGQVMKITRGQAKPNLVNEAVKDRLDAIKSA